MMPSFPPTVPILGQSFVVLAHYPTVIVQCQCEAKSILAIIDAQNVATCPACEKGFAIAERPKMLVGEVRKPVGV